MIRPAALLTTAVRRRSELRPLGRALWLLPLTTRRIRRLGNRAVSSASMLDDTSVAATPEQLARAKRLSRIVQLASHYGLSEGTCLSRSLVLLELLKSESLPRVLRIGVRMPGTASTGLEAHAWVECGSIALNDRGDAGGNFVPFAEPASRATSAADATASANVA